MSRARSAPTPPSGALDAAAHALSGADYALYRRRGLLPPGVCLAWHATARYALRARRVAAREPRRDDVDATALAAAASDVLHVVTAEWAERRTWLQAIARTLHPVRRLLHAVEQSARSQP